MAPGKIREDLDGSVTVHRPDGTFRSLVAGDDVPEEYAEQVGDHLLAGKGTPNPSADSDAPDLSGSAADVLARVGDDPVKAQAYLAAEQAGEARKGLSADLEKLAAGS